MPSKLKRIRKYKWSKRLKTHGFLSRNATNPGRNVLSRRRQKGRHILTVLKTKK